MQYHHGNLHEALLQHGDDELREHGPDQLSLRQIAKRAGVSHNAPYRHFRDKDDLVEQLLERALNQLAEQILNASLLYPGSLLYQMQFVGRLFAQLAIREPYKTRLLFASHGVVSATGGQRLANTHRLVMQNIASLLEGSRELKAQPSSQNVAAQIMMAYHGAALMRAANTLPEITGNEQETFDLFDNLTQNLLHSFWL